ncbi:tyrosine-type recombinase/integrase [Cerasicoccus arenae]|uniref:Core-binding (CB) domain-containing protein n=2 Tax=Cerasicoccus arenae TaxID=424488 RepID=A0A8J3GDI7_9BACT|nr:site-specific integrase [Cerasicoccus arenae]GHC01897.1 hypothetical protein GCM10007047_17930 [Cerasicoccus arenae]
MQLIAEIENFVLAREVRSRLRSTSLDEAQLRDAEVALQLLPKGISLTQIARKFVVSDRGDFDEDPINKWIDAFRTEKEEIEQRRPKTVSNLLWRINQFINYSNVETLGDFSRESAARFLTRSHAKTGKKLSAQTMQNDWLALHSFGGYLVKVKAVANNPLQEIGRAQVEWKPPAIHNASEVAALLKASLQDVYSAGKYTPYFVICCFCGVRPEAEAPYLRMKDVTLAKSLSLSELRVTRQKVTTAKQRSVPLNAAAWRWLQYCQKQEWEIAVPTKNAYIRIRLAAGLLGSWSGDIMRHTYATMTLANGANKRDLAEWMGNSPRQIENSYMNLAKYEKSAARKWLNIKPPQ